MYKKILTFKILVIFCLCINTLTGAEKGLNGLTVSSYETNWNTLYVEGHQIDLKAAELAEEKLKGGHYDRALHAVIPTDMTETEQEWKRAKNRIANVIGPIPNFYSQESVLWENSANNIENLAKDAQFMAPLFQKDFQAIASITGTAANFGPGDQYIVKTHESLENKVKRDASTLHISEEEAVAKIGDTLRGTIIVDDPNKIPAVVAEIMNYADYREGQVIFKNLWMEDRESGYVGIHAKLHLPLPIQGNSGEERYILAEMQIHLRSLVDGTNESAKERAHLIYEHVRSEEANPVELSAASKLLFLTGMQDVLKSL